MGTNFTAIYDRFLGKITDDMYMELTPQDTLKDLQRLLINAIPGFEFPRKNLYNYEIQRKSIPESELAEDDYVLGLVWNDFMEEGIELEDLKEDFIQYKQSIWELFQEEHPGEHFPEDDFYVLVEASCFEEILTAEEQEILAILMMNNWLQRQITSVENTRMKYSGPDFKMTSQANHLSKLQSLLTECQRQSHHLQRLYKRRELNEDGKYVSSWYWFGQHGTNNIRE